MCPAGQQARGPGVSRQTGYTVKKMGEELGSEDTDNDDDVLREERESREDEQGGIWHIEHDHRVKEALLPQRRRRQHSDVERTLTEVP